MDEAVWLIIAAGAAGLLAGAFIASLAFLPLREKAAGWRGEADRLSGIVTKVCDERDAKRAESARYAAAIARITTSLASAKPDTSQPFYPHRLAAFREAVAIVLDAAKDATA